MIKGKQNIRRYIKLKWLWEIALIKHDVTAARVYRTEWELMLG